MTSNPAFHQELAGVNASPSSNESLKKDYISLRTTMYDASLAMCVLKTIVCTAGAVGNLYVLKYLKERRQRQHMHVKSGHSDLTVFIYSLAISDVLIFLNIPSVWITFAIQIHFGWLCKLKAFASLIFPAITINNLAVIGVERYILTCRPTSRPFSRAATTRALKGAWVLGFLATLFRASFVDSVRIDVNATHYTTRCKFDNNGAFISLVLFQSTTVIGFIIPIACVVYTSSFVMRHIWKRNANYVSATEKDVSTAIRELQVRKATIRLMVIVFAFLVPYSLFVGYNSVVVIFKPRIDPVSDFAVRNAAILLAYFNSFINFSIHLVQLPGFWSYLKSHKSHVKIHPKPNILKENTAVECEMGSVTREAGDPADIEVCPTRRRASEAIRLESVTPFRAAVQCRRRHSA